MQGPGRFTILGTGFDPVTLAEAVARIEAMTGEPRREAGPGIVVTANPEIVQAARRDPQLQSILHQADLVLPDDIGVVCAGRVLGLRFPERVSGADLVEALLERGAGRGWRFFFLGGRPAMGGNPSVAEAAAANVERRYPGVKSAGFMHGYFSPSEDEEVVRSINESGADILLVGMGAPRQEKWMWRRRSHLSVAACIGVGGTLDVL
ncbi:MAG: WecB/TagA/CpsF family glycosyltransferase, partial [Bacillota bacterium]